MRGYVTKVLNTTIAAVKAQALDGSGLKEFDIVIYGTRKIENDRKSFRMLERESGRKDQIVIYEVVNVRHTKTLYRMPVEDFVSQAEKVQSF